MRRGCGPFGDRRRDEAEERQRSRPSESSLLMFVVSCFTLRGVYSAGVCVRSEDETGSLLATCRCARRAVRRGFGNTESEDYLGMVHVLVVTASVSRPKDGW